MLVTYLRLPAAAVTQHTADAPAGVPVNPWELFGGTPALPEVLMNIPVALLTEELFEKLASIDGAEMVPFEDEEGWAAADFHSVQGSAGGPPPAYAKAPAAPLMFGAAPSGPALLTGGGRGRGRWR